MRETREDLPYIPFYFGDWMKAPEIRALNLDTRMVWFEMMGFMWQSDDRGFLIINGKPIPENVLSRMLGITEEKLTKFLQEMSSFGVFSVRKTDNSIYCRRMVEEEKLRKIRSLAGKTGMKSRYNKNKKPVITKPITNTDNDNDNDNDIKNKKVEIKKIKQTLDDNAWLESLKTNPLFKNVNFEFEFQKMDFWLTKNPSRKKSRRFVENWLLKSADKAIQNVEITTKPELNWEQKNYEYEKRIAQERREEIKKQDAEAAAQALLDEAARNAEPPVWEEESA